LAAACQPAVLFPADGVGQRFVGEREVALVWPKNQPDSGGALQAVLRETFLPNAVRAAAEEGQAPVSFLQGKTAQGGLPTAYVCERGRCELPTTDPEVFRQQLRKTRPY
jgi:uncharacterized protein YyaL (SSP411 family)